jgi:hypothetical protein
VPVDLTEINRAARATAGAVHVEPWHAGDQRRPDRGRPQHVAAGGKLLIPALDNALRLGARGIVGNLPLGSYGNVESPRRCELLTEYASKCILQGEVPSAFLRHTCPGR